MGLGEKAITVSRAAVLFEEFVAREAKAGRFGLKFKPAGQDILLHGHCHQKAFAAVTPILEVLRLIPGAKPRLLPAVRNAPNAIVVADGTSCRHQIADGTRRQAVHVALLLDQLIAD